MREAERERKRESDASWTATVSGNQLNDDSIYGFLRVCDVVVVSCLAYILNRSKYCHKTKQHLKQGNRRVLKSL